MVGPECREPKADRRCSGAGRSEPDSALNLIEPVQGGGRAGDFAESRVVRVVVWRRELRAVEKIERVYANLKDRSFPQSEVAPEVAAPLVEPVGPHAGDIDRKNARLEGRRLIGGIPLELRARIEPSIQRLG